MYKVFQKREKLENKKDLLFREGWKWSYLNVEWSSQLVATFCLHSLHFCVMECMESQMLDFTVILNNEDPKSMEWIQTLSLSTLKGFF